MTPNAGRHLSGRVLRDDRVLLLAGVLGLSGWFVFDAGSAPILLATTGSDTLQRAIAPGSLATSGDDR